MEKTAKPEVVLIFMSWACYHRILHLSLNPIRLGGPSWPPYTFLLITSDKMELFTSNHHENSFLCLTDGINHDLVKIDSFFYAGSRGQKVVVSQKRQILDQNWRKQVCDVIYSFKMTS